LKKNDDFMAELQTIADDKYDPKYNEISRYQDYEKRVKKKEAPNHQ